MSGAASPPPWKQPAVWGNIATLSMLALLACALTLLQSGDWSTAWPRSSRWTGAAVAVVAYLWFCAAVLWRSRARQQDRETPVGADTPFVLVAYASQTGFAQQLAERSAESLRLSGVSVKLRALGEVDRQLLATAERALFVASTTGEGDPPDPALGFVRAVMGQPAALGHLGYAVLALGDREYEHFCGFGHQLDAWLRGHGGRPLFDLVEVDNADESALRHWQHHLGQIGGITDLPDWTPPRYEPWILRERRQLNPGSVGGGAFHLVIAPPAGTSPSWQAGDIAEIGPRHSIEPVTELLQAIGLDIDSGVEIDGVQESLATVLARSHLPTKDAIRGLDAQSIAKSLKPLPHREYSISSLPIDGSVQVLLRRMLRPDGNPGIGSGWLCDYAPVGGEIALRLRSNPNFHAPDLARPLVLIGNGTGIAGLRALLKERVAAGVRCNWLLFGERNASHDFFHGDEIREWQAQGFLQRVDLAFSRDQERRIYVQHSLEAASGALREWVAAGAAIYVCGSLSGMAPGVDAVLRAVLGDTEVETMLADGRYRRDVY
ncbi:MAG: sulfite reductase flavoprotein subunit alpha [Pseudoxanthomonas sp.]